MGKTRHRAIPVAVAGGLLAALSAGCGRKSTAAAEPASASTTPPPAPSTAPPPAPVTPPAATASAGEAPDDAVIARVRGFFERFKAGSDFEFLREWCASPVERFLMLRNARVDQVVSSARGFFLDKLVISYTPTVSAIAIERRDGVTIARLPVAMMWATTPPDGFGDSPSTYDPARSDLTPLWNGLIEHNGTADVELAFAPDGRIERYVEVSVRRPRLRVTGEESCEMGTLHKGQTVVDLGDAFVTSISVKGPQQIHHVQAGAEQMWVDEIRSWEVDNPAGGTSAGGSTCLAPAPDAPAKGP